MKNTLAVQTRDTHGTSYLLGCENTHLRRSAVLSPFFQLKRFPLDSEIPGRTGHMSSSRDIRISEIMTKIGFFVGYAGDGQSLDALIETVTDGVSDGITAVPFDPSTATDAASLKTLAESAVADWASLTGVTPITKVAVFADDIPSGLANAPQAAIANAPADAVTNYNVVTTLLGTLTSAVNAANAKQNDIATKLNTLLSELRALGLIST